MPVIDTDCNPVKKINSCCHIIYDSKNKFSVMKFDRLQKKDISILYYTRCVEMAIMSKVHN